MSVIQRKDLITDEAISWPDKYKKDLEQIVATSKKLGQSAKVPGSDPKAKKNITELQKVQTQLNTANAKGNKLVIEKKAALDRLNKTNREQVKALNETIALENKQLGTLEKLALVNKKLTDERKKLNLETAKGQKRLKEINSQLDKNNKRIKDNNDALGRQKINIGNYKDAISGLPGPLGQAARATNALTGSALKFIATPIGAVIAALGLAIGALTTFFKGSEEGQNALNKITKAAMVIWGNFTDILSDVGKGFFKFLKGDFAGAKDAFNDAAEGVRNFVDETKEEIKVQNELSDLQAKNLILLRESRIFEAKSLTKISELREEAAKVEETNAVKAAEFIREAIRLNDQIAAKKEEVLKNDLRIAREEAELNNSRTEDLNAIADAEVALENARRARAKANVMRLKELNTLEKKAATQAKNNSELVIKSFEELKAKAPTPDEKLDVLLPTTDAIKERLDANLEAYKEGQKQIAEIDEEQADIRNELIATSVNLSKEIFGGFTDLRIQQISDELNALEFARNRELEDVGNNERAKFEINKKFDAERRALQRKQANTEKANALFLIAINTAVAVTRISAEAALAAPFLIPGIIATGIVQAAAVLAAPLPQFDAGTESTPKDYMIAEKGPELQKRKGKWSLINKPTIFRNSPGDKIISGKETDSILGGMADLTGNNILSDPSLLTGLLNNDFEKKKNSADLAYIIRKGNEDVVRAITRKPSVSISVSNSRTDVIERVGNIKINHTDAYYRGKT